MEYRNDQIVKEYTDEEKMGYHRSLLIQRFYEMVIPKY
jgi:hypothetical protein